MEASGDLQPETMVITVFVEDEDLSYPPRDIRDRGVKVLSGLSRVPTAARTHLYT